MKNRSCLFNSLKKAIHAPSINLRSLIADYISNDPIAHNDTHFSSIIQWETGLSLDEYVKKIKKPSVMGGATEILAFCQIYDVNVMVLFDDDDSQCTNICVNEYSSYIYLQYNKEKQHYYL